MQDCSNPSASANHYGDVKMDAIASQITNLTIFCSTVYADANQRKHQSSASLAFVWGIHRGPVNSTPKWPVTRKMFPFDDIIMNGITAVLYKAIYITFRCVYWHWGNNTNAPVPVKHPWKLWVKGPIRTYGTITMKRAAIKQRAFVFGHTVLSYNYHISVESTRCEDR